jgi:predicted DCC family thiol-disulfide oxidoreductase YuxK
MPGTLQTDKQVILFDGICNLCNGVVQFVIKKDKKDVFRFASLQSDFGQSLLKQYNLNQSTFNSLILYESGKIYTKSTAALRVAKALPGAWSILYALIIVPKFVRDACYNIVAANRYRWFGKQESCWLPTENLKIKFF